MPDRSAEAESHPDPLALLKRGFKTNDAHLILKLFEQHPELKAKINDPVSDCFDAPAITMVRSREILDVMLEAGADINAKSRWWAGGFGLLHTAKPELAAYAIERGAIIDVHAAARLGLLDKLRELITADPELVHARGGDGQTPLHFASTVEIAKFLLDRGADIEARDVDHESTAAQYMVKDRQEVLRYLIQRGCKTDLLMAAALGDANLVRQHLDQDRACVRLRVSDEYFPMINEKSGGTIYQWMLGWYVSAHQVAKQFGHEHLVELLTKRSPPVVNLMNACWLGEEAKVHSLIAQHPNLAADFTEEDRRYVAHAARNNDSAAVRLMLAAGLPVDGCGQHKATPLHWAAWHGNMDMVRLILRHKPPLEDNNNEFHGTPLRWAVHGSKNGWHRETGDYGQTVETLIEAGATLPAKVEGNEAVRAVLKRHGLPE